MAKKKGFRCEVSVQNLILGLVAAGLFLFGLYLFMIIITEQVSFSDSPYPRQNRGIFLIMSWLLMAIPFLILAPNRQGLLPAMGIFLGAYLSCVYATGTVMVFEFTSTQMIDYAVAAKIITPVVCFIVIFVMLVYNAVSGQEFFRTVIFGGVAFMFIVGAVYAGVL